MQRHTTVTFDHDDFDKNRFTQDEISAAIAYGEKRDSNVWLEDAAFALDRIKEYLEETYGEAADERIEARKDATIQAFVITHPDEPQMIGIMAADDYAALSTETKAGCVTTPIAISKRMLDRLVAAFDKIEAAAAGKQ
jgi:hypothetical protein